MSNTVELILASGNPKKVEEIKAMTAELDLQIKSLSDIGFTDEIAETGTTLDQNSLIKASHIFDLFEQNVLAEDTGLEVESLNHAPGVYTARYAGSEKNAEENMALLLKNIQGKSNRKARFRTVATLFWQDKMYQFEGIVNGLIIEEQKGNGGFGYDPIFMPDGYDQTFGELAAEVKNEISHRARAIEKVIQFIRKT